MLNSETRTDHHDHRNLADARMMCGFRSLTCWPDELFCTVWPNVRIEYYFLMNHIFILFYVLHKCIAKYNTCFWEKTLLFFIYLNSYLRYISTCIMWNIFRFLTGTEVIKSVHMIKLLIQKRAWKVLNSRICQGQTNV